MRIQLTGRWTIELDGTWERRRQRRAQPATAWTGSIGTVLVQDVHTAAAFRCTSNLEILSALSGEVPPDAVRQLGESGTEGIGHRAAWVYADALWGYTFVNRHYLRTAFLSADTDLSWAFTAWRSIRFRLDPADPGRRAA